MKKLLLATVLTGLMTGSVALAIPTSGQITVGLTPGSQYSDGGEFNATVGSTTFQTFCIESLVNFSAGGTYYYTLGAVNHANQYLTVGTAWLYWKFATSQFTGGHFLPLLDAGALQAAIWNFQGQTFPNNDYTGWGNGAVGSDTFATGASTALLALLSQPYDPNTSTYDYLFGGDKVWIIQTSTLPDGRGTPVQDWLYVQPNSVPDGGTTAILLGAGLLGIGLASRKFATTR